MDSTPASLSRTALDVDSKSNVAVDVKTNKEVESDHPVQDHHADSYKGFRFRMVFVSICVCVFLSALEFVSRHCLGPATPLTVFFFV